MKCFLYCLNNTHNPIPLPDGSPVYIGRNPLTKITDTRCSRQQLQLKADYNHKQVTVKQIGNNASAVESNELGCGETTIVGDGTIINILSNLYPHKIKFSEKSSSGNTPDKLTENQVVPQNTKEDTFVRPDSKAFKSKNEKSEGQNADKLIENQDVQQNAKEDNFVKPSLKAVKGAKRKSADTSTNSETHPKKVKVEPMNDDDINPSQPFDAVTESEEVKLKKIAEKLRLMKDMVKTEDSTSTFKRPVNEQCGEPAKMNRWLKIGKLLTYISKDVQARKKIAAFDIDGTIIGTSSGKVFPTHPGDWKILYGEIPTKLKRLHRDGYKVVFVTNQLGVERGKTKESDLKTKFTSVIERVGVPVQILISTGSGLYRKPATGMWNYLMAEGNDGIEIDMKESFYVGDAAGRAEKWSPGKKKDFSCSDRLFALNIGLKFYTPEEYFQGWKPAPYKLPEFNPMSLKSDLPLTSPIGATVISNSQEVVVTVGFPASGKTYFVQKTMLKGDYIHVNRDKLGSWQKCVAACKKALQQNHSVIIDNTSPDIEARQRYLSVAREMKVPCRCFNFTATHQQARHNERFREMTDKSHHPINDMIMNSYKSKFKEPTISEGFTEIIKINFVPKFSDPSHKKLFFQYLLDK